MDEWLKESYKKDIKNFLNTRFIPKYAPRDKDNKYGIEEIESSVWSISLEKENIMIIFLFLR